MIYTAESVTEAAEHNPSPDGYECTIRAYVIGCWVCQRRANHGALHLSGKVVLREAMWHLIGGPGDRPLCERT